MPRLSKRWPHTFLLPALALIVLVFAFVGGPDYYSPRSFQLAWNLGHVVAFMLWACLCLLYFQSLARLSLVRQFALFALAAAIFGALIEIVQSQLGRQASWNDLLSDILGSLLAVSLLSAQRRQIKTALRILIQTVLIMTVVVLHRGFFVALLDDYYARRQFPVLADFSAPFELSRWGGDAAGQLLHIPGNRTVLALKVLLTTDLYSGVGLKHAPANWQGYSFLRLRLYNPAEDELLITCRIHDKQHTQGDQVYSDRFNRRIRLSPGWNTVQISLQDIIDAPASRKMDITRINGLGIFSTRLQQVRSLFISEIKLIRQ